MSRLIDADRVIYILEQLKSHSLTGQMNIGNAIYLICEQPTAYDIDKVIDEIEKRLEEPQYQHSGEDYYVGLIEALDIVKEGGIE